MTDKEKFQKTFDTLHASPEVLTEVLNMTRDNNIISMNSKTKKYNKKKLAVIAVVACMMIGTTTFAAGRITSYLGWSNPKNAITSYSDAVNKAEDLGSELALPEKFANGYSFANANENRYKGLDEHGNVLVDGTDFTATYSKANSPDIYMFVNQDNGTDESRYITDTKVVNDTEINLQHAIYKMVPSDYELTDEDKVNQEKPNYEISYGTEKVEEQNYDGFTFVKNGKRYSMFAWDCDMTDNDWYEMAEELLN